MLAIDFETAFDSLNFNNLLRVLHAFNFGPSFIQWIRRVLYNKASSCVMNNGFTTGPFALSRGVRQGDPSPYLFIIALETVAIKVRDVDSIKGITIRDETVKLSLFADDMTCFIKGNSSYTTNLFVTLKTFGEFSGLKINNEKTEAGLALGNSRSISEGHSYLPNLCNTIKILGVYFDFGAKQRDELNFRNTLKSPKQTINLWKWRGLSLLGRTQIIKTFAIPKLTFTLFLLFYLEWESQSKTNCDDIGS